MRKWIGLTLAALLVIVFLPAGFGLLAKKSLGKLVSDLPLPEGVSLSLQDYTFGWLSSYVAIKIHAIKNEQPPHYWADEAVDMIIHGNITHGPLLNTAQGVQLGIARLDTHATLNDIKGLNENIQKELALLFKDNDLLRASSVFYLTGGTAIDLKSSSMQTQADGDTLQWNGLNAHIKINREFNAFDMDATLSPLLFTTAKGAVLDTARIELDVELQRESAQPWVGEQALTIPTFYLKDESGALLRFDHLKIMSVSHMIEGLLQASLDVEADNIEFNNSKIDQLRFDLELSDFASQPLWSINQLMHQPQAWATKDQQALLEMVTQALIPGADVELDYVLNIQQQQVLLRVLLSFPDIRDKVSPIAAENVQELLKNLNAELEFRAPQHIVKDFLFDRTASTWQQQIGVQTLSKADVDKIKVMIENQLGSFIQAGALSAKNHNYQLEFNYHPGSITLNDRPLTPQEVVLLFTLLSQATPNESTTH